jgi:predicted phosphodiesterase
VSNLVIVGDLFDSPEDARGIMAKEDSIGKILGFDDLAVKVFFVWGSPPHDPSPSDQLVFAHAPFTPLGRCAILDFKQLRVVAYHGHDLSLRGAVGHGWDRFISKLSLERAWKRLAGVANSDWVIFGHTHIPGTGPMSGLLCHKCHDPHSRTNPTSAVCSSECHRNQASVGQHAVHMQKVPDCMFCHKPHTWTVGRDAARKLCGRCHPPKNPQLFLF